MLFETFTDVGRSNYDYFLVQFISEFYKSKEKLSIIHQRHVSAEKLCVPKPGDHGFWPDIPSIALAPLHM